MKNYKELKEDLVSKYYNTLNEARDLVSKISENRNIVLEAIGVAYVMVDPFGDYGDLSDVIRVESGVIYLENGSEVDVSDVTNLTDLVGLLETIEE